MKKYLLLLNFVFLTAIAQNVKETNAVVEYNISNNTDSPNTLTSALFINGQVTIDLPKYSTIVLNDAIKEAKESTKMTFDPFYTKVDHKIKEIYFFEGIGPQMYLIKDDYNNLKWNITDETKNIGGYNSIKATTEFRGRKWIAWFTPDIPLPYGPWKLHGLPGLITEVFDETEKYGWVIQKIEYRRDAIFDKKFASLVETRNKKPIHIKQYIRDEEEYVENMDAEMLRTTPGIVKIENAPRGGYELKYEWE